MKSMAKGGRWPRPSPQNGLLFPGRKHSPSFLASSTGLFLITVPPLPKLRFCLHAAFLVPTHVLWACADRVRNGLFPLFKGCGEVSTWTFRFSIQESHNLSRRSPLVSCQGRRTVHEEKGPRLLRNHGIFLSSLLSNRRNRARLTTSGKKIRSCETIQLPIDHWPMSGQDSIVSFGDALTHPPLEPFTQVNDHDLTERGVSMRRQMKRWSLALLFSFVPGQGLFPQRCGPPRPRDSSSSALAERAYRCGITLPALSLASSSRWEARHTAHLVRASRLIRVVKTIRMAKGIRVVKLLHLLRLIRLSMLKRVTVWNHDGRCVSCS